MKKLLGILGAAGLVVSTSAVLVSCGSDNDTVLTPEQKAQANGQESVANLKAITELKVSMADIKDEKDTTDKDDSLHALLGTVIWSTIAKPADQNENFGKQIEVVKDSMVGGSNLLWEPSTITTVIDSKAEVQDWRDENVKITEGTTYTFDLDVMSYYRNADKELLSVITDGATFSVTITK